MSKQEIYKILQKYNHWIADSVDEWGEEVIHCGIKEGDIENISIEIYSNLNNK